MEKPLRVGELGKFIFRGCELIVSVFEIFHNDTLARVIVMDDKFGSDTLTVQLYKIQRINE